MKKKSPRILFRLVIVIGTLSLAFAGILLLMNWLSNSGFFNSGTKDHSFEIAIPPGYKVHGIDVSSH